MSSQVKCVNVPTMGRKVSKGKGEGSEGEGQKVSEG